jgi:hypothetical protein
VSDYRLSEDPADLDLDRVVRWISEDAYWAKGRTREVIERGFANSFPVGLYAPGGQQVAVWAADWAGRQDIKRVVLSTLDAHGVYAKAGFVPIAHPERWMEIDFRPPIG